jgi:23S rRNA (adenine2503-C2)-methyltransferase
LKESKFILDLTYNELEDHLKSLGAEPYRAKQILDSIYKKLAGSFAEIKGLPAVLSKRLSMDISFSHLSPRIDLLSSDKWTRKILFDLPDGSQVETVLMGYEKRRTVCISTQAGCGLGCTFCATGQAGLQRNITAGEIVEQVLFFERILKNDIPSPSGRVREGLTNIVMMGMGEPFVNYNEVMKAIEILTSPDEYNFGARRITVSTVGIVPMINKFAEEHSQVNLAVSLHAASNKLRESMLPINKKYPLEELIPACRNYTEITHRRISFEWALIDSVNDTPEQANSLAKLIKGMLCHVNLIPLNPTEEYNGKESNTKNIQKFRAVLDRHGIPNTLRLRRGIDIHAGCGQLRQAYPIPPYGRK